MQYETICKLRKTILYEPGGMEKKFTTFDSAWYVQNASN